MKGDSYILKIDNPCNEDWTSMSPNETGKYCLHCSKSVIDFTHLTDNQIIHLLEKNSNNLCGRFTDEQLNRIIEIRQPSKSSQLYRLLAGLLFVGATENTLAVDKPFSEIESVSLFEDKELNLVQSLSAEKPVLDSLNNILQGIVLDSQSKQSIPFVTVAVYVNEILIVFDKTNIDGKFRFVIPDSLISSNLNLKVGTYGYGKVNINLEKSNLKEHQVFLVRSQNSREVTMRAGRVEIDTIKKKKWWQRKSK